MNYLDNLYIGAKLRISNFLTNFKNEEEGISNIVATVLLIVIVVALAAFLWAALSGWLGRLWETLIEGKSEGIGEGMNYNGGGN